MPCAILRAGPLCPHCAALPTWEYQLMALAQIIITMNSAGVLRCEAPGKNGMRQKIDLPCDWSFLNPVLVAELKSQLAAAKRTVQAPAATRVDPQIAREARIAQARADHLREWTERFNAGTDVEREIMLYRREQAQRKSQELEHARAKAIWEQTAADHGIALANRVITDPKRRPRIARVVNGNKPSVDHRLAINITL